MSFSQGLGHILIFDVAVICPPECRIHSFYRIVLITRQWTVAFLPSHSEDEHHTYVLDPEIKWNYHLCSLRVITSSPSNKDSEAIRGVEMR